MRAIAKNVYSQKPDDTTNSLDCHDHYSSTEGDERKTNCPVASSMVRSARRQRLVSPLLPSKMER
jgi:hypothetical protein